MSKRINMLQGYSAQGGIGVGLMTAAGNPWVVADGLADDLVNRAVAAYVDQAPKPRQSVFFNPNSGIFEDANGQEVKVASASSGPKKTGSYVTKMGCGLSNTLLTADYCSTEQKPLDIYPPYALRLGLINTHLTNVNRIALAKLALVPTDLNNGAGAIWYPARVGRADSYDIPVAVQGPYQTNGEANNKIPSMLFIDVAPVAPVARTDTPGAPYLLQFRAKPVAGTQLSLTGGPITRTNSSKPYLADRGYLFGWQQSAGDVVTAPGAVALQGISALGLIGSIEVFTANSEHLNLYAFGDSLTAGYSATPDGGEVSYINGVSFNMRAKGIIGGISNFAVGGQLQETYIATMKSVINAGAMPSAVIISAFSPNSGTSTQAQWDAQFGNAVEAVNWLLARNIAVYLTDAMPLNSLNATRDGYRKAFNNKLYATMGSMRGVTVVRFAQAIEDPADSSKINPAYNNEGIHQNAAGEEIKTAVMSAALGL